MHDGWPDTACGVADRQVMQKYSDNFPLVINTFLCSDATAHMVEEVRNSSSVIPKAMIWSYIINGLMVYLMLTTYCFCLTNLGEAFESDTGCPFIAVFTNTAGSAAGGAGITCVLIFLISFSVTNYMASCSRQVFAFARNGGLPFHTWIATVTECLWTLSNDADL